MSRKGKRVLKVIALLYLAAVIAFLVSIPYGRARRTRPELVPTEVTVPREGDFEGRGGGAAYRRTRREFVDAGYRLRVPVAEFDRGRLLGEEELAHLIEQDVRKVKVWDPRPCRDLAAEKLRCGEEITDAVGNPIARIDDELTEKRLVDIAMVYDEKPVGEGLRKERLDRIWVRGTGSIVGFDLTLVFTGLNFLALVALLYALLWEPVTRILDDRARAIREDIETARGQREEAESARAGVDRELADIRRDARKMREEGRSEGEKDKAQLVEEGREEARRLAERTERALSAEAESARRELLAGLGDASALLASKMLGREVTSADHERLTSEFLRSLEAGAGQAGVPGRE